MRVFVCYLNKRQSATVRKVLIGNSSPDLSSKGLVSLKVGLECVRNPFRSLTDFLHISSIYLHGFYKCYNIIVLSHFLSDQSSIRAPN